MEESVVLTATLRDEASAPLEGLKKEFDGATQTVEKSNKAQASSTKEASAIMATAMDRAGGASTDMAKALDQASGTGSSAWGKLKTSATGASNEAITAARKQATELSTSVKVQESALTHLEGAHRDSLHAQEQAAAGATAAQQRLDELRATATTPVTGCLGTSTGRNSMAFSRVLAKAAAGASEPGRIESVWRGTVTEVLADGMVWVEVPALAGAEPLGPLPVFGTAAAPDAQVLVLAVGGRRDDLVVLPPVL